MNNYSEQRKHKRLPVRTHVFVWGDTIQRFKTETMDFSESGLFIEGKILSLLQINTLIKIQSADSSLEDAPEVTARVAWTNRYGAGIEYLTD